jgi:hypothetical protein
MSDETPNKPPPTVYVIGGQDGGVQLATNEFYRVSADCLGDRRGCQPRISA